MPRVLFAGLWQLRKAMLIPHTKENWLNLMRLHTRMCLGGQDGLVLLIVSCRHLSIRNGDRFRHTKTKPTNPSLAIQRLMAWYVTKLTFLYATVMSTISVFDYTFCMKQGKDIRRFAGTVPNVTTTGDLESMVMFAGEGVGLIKEILPAGEVVKQLVEGAQLIIQQNLN